MYAFLTKTLLR